MAHFHVTLPSNSSLDSYPNNTASRFTTKLPDRIELGSEYEVGLSEIIYPHTWFNFDNSDGRYALHYRSTDRTYTSITFKSAYYPDGMTFANDLNRQLAPIWSEYKSGQPTFKFTFSPSTMKMNIYNNNKISIQVSLDFIKLLGFSESYFLRMLGAGATTGVTTASKILTVKGVKSMMYIYCDVVSYSIVGDIEAPLLRVCSSSGKDGDMVRNIYTHPHYVPVARNDFEAIEINISDDLGRPVPFLHGKSLVTLHFRPKNESLLHNTAF